MASDLPSALRLHKCKNYKQTVIYVLKLSRRLNSMTRSRAIIRVTCLYETDVSRTISVIIIIRGLIRQTSSRYNSALDGLPVLTLSTKPAKLITKTAHHCDT